MSWFNRIRNVTIRLASDALSGARRLASNITESARRRVTNFGNWLCRARTNTASIKRNCGTR